jgi:hypothetical protein
MATHVSLDTAPESAPASRAASVASTGEWIVLGVVWSAAVAVFWAFDALPFQDLPAHAGLIAMRHRFAESAFEQRHFVLAPHIGPYSLFRFLGDSFLAVMSPTSAVRALATLPVIATPLALLFARRRLFDDRSPTFGFVGIALSFGLMTLLGFASYLLGVAVMIFGLTLWLDLLAASDDRAPNALRKELVVAVFAPIMFIAHGHAFVLFLLCAGVSCIVTGRRWARLLRLRSLVPALGVAGWVAWIERGATTPPGSVPVVPRLVPTFHDLADKIGLLVTPTLTTRSGIDVALVVVIWALTIVVTILTLASARSMTRHTRALHACALAVTVLFLALPHSVGWFGFVDGRLVPVILYLALLGVSRDALPVSVARLFETAMPVTAGAIATLALVSSHKFQDEATGYREVLAKVPAETKLLNLPLDPNSDVFTAHPFIHYDKLVLAERPIIVSDVWFHQGSALYPTPANPALQLPPSYSESDLRVIDWPAYRLGDWDYVLIRTRPGAPQPHTPDRLALEEHRGGWWLFKRR